MGTEAGFEGTERSGGLGAGDSNVEDTGVDSNDSRGDFEIVPRGGVVGTEDVGNGRFE